MINQEERESRTALIVILLSALFIFYTSTVFIVYKKINHKNQNNIEILK
jgi:hypothetical protein